MSGRKKILLNRILIDNSELYEFLNYSINFFLEDDKKTSKLEESGVFVIEFLDSYIDFAWNSLKVYLSKEVIDWMSWFIYELNHEQQNGLVDTSMLATYSDGRPIFRNKEEFIHFLVETQNQTTEFDIEIKDVEKKEQETEQSIEEDTDLDEFFGGLFSFIKNIAEPPVNQPTEQKSKKNKTSDTKSEVVNKQDVLVDFIDFVNKCNIKNRTFETLKKQK